MPQRMAWLAMAPGLTEFELELNMNADRMSVELNLAAAIALLSSSALHGATPAKAKALRLHLRAISEASDIAVNLRTTAADLLAQWDALQCQPVTSALSTANHNSVNWLTGSKTTH